jgi:hypothetical protein
MDYNGIVYTALERYFTGLSRVGYYSYNNVYDLVALILLNRFSEFLTEEDIKYCKLNSIIDHITESLCFTSDIYKECPNISIY